MRGSLRLDRIYHEKALVVYLTVQTANGPKNMLK